MSNYPLCLPDTLKIDTVSEFKLTIDQALKSGADFDVDASGLEAIDFSGLQLLIAFVSEVNVNGSTLIWQSVSDAFQSAADDLGANRFLNLPNHAG